MLAVHLFSVTSLLVSIGALLVTWPRNPFGLSRWRGGRYACDTPDIMGCQCVLDRVSPFFANMMAVNPLQAKIDSIPIA
jgi:hypothetical protein